MDDAGNGKTFSNTLFLELRASLFGGCGDLGGTPACVKSNLLRHVTLSEVPRFATHPNKQCLSKPLSTSTKCGLPLIGRTHHATPIQAQGNMCWRGFCRWLPLASNSDKSNLIIRCQLKPSTKRCALTAWGSPQICRTPGLLVYANLSSLQCSLNPGLCILDGRILDSTGAFGWQGFGFDWFF